MTNTSTPWYTRVTTKQKLISVAVVIALMVVILIAGKVWRVNHSEAIISKNTTTVGVATSVYDRHYRNSSRHHYFAVFTYEVDGKSYEVTNLDHEHRKDTTEKAVADKLEATIYYDPNNPSQAAFKTDPLEP